MTVFALLWVTDPDGQVLFFGRDSSQFVTGTDSNWPSPRAMPREEARPE